MAKGDLILSPQWGVNPCIPKCFYCLKDKNEILLMGKLPGDVKAPENMVLNDEPCDACKALMERGIILISVKTGEDGPNPYRTGGWVVVRDEFLHRVLTAEHAVELCRKRIAFVPDDAWDQLGLPR